LTIALAGALAFEQVYEVSIRVRPPDPLAAMTGKTADAASRPPLALRLVDSGGVGIPLDGWGTDYSHDRRIFRTAIREGPPYVDAPAFGRIEQEWRAYVERMLQYGNNAIATPLLLELIDFDRVTPPDAAPIYGTGSPFRARHAAIRRHFGPLFEWTDRRGMQVFLEADMPTLTAPLAAYLRAVAPAGAAGIDASNPAVWDVYRAGLAELFDTFPSVKGIVIRFGEGGSLYNTEGWPYRSEVAVRSTASLQAMLRGLLPVFEERGRTLVLRSWTVGVGQVGRLHIDPKVYEAVLGGIDSPALIVSTKFPAGDFFSYLPLNPTLAQGRHRRIVELQAKPEFEGFNAFPDFLGEEYSRALRALRAANPHIVGAYVLTQAGGPLRAGPRALYPLHGVWLWTDANVFVASRLAADPGAAEHALARTWAERTFGNDPRIVDAVTSALTETREAVLKGFYIRPFAEREVRVPGLELPPLMWIFEWDMVGGWHSLLSLVYRGSRDAVDLAIDEGHASAAAVRRARQRLQDAFAAAGPNACSSACNDARRSLEYQETLFDVLAAWRQAFLSYYRWLETGDGGAWTEWRSGRAAFATAARRHGQRFGADLDFPAFDLTSATRAVAVADRSAVARIAASGLLLVVIALIGLGSPLMRRWRALPRLGLGGVTAVARLTWTAAVVPWRLGREPVSLGAAAAVTALALVIVGIIAQTFTGFTTPWVGAGSIVLVATVGLAFESTATRGGVEGRGRLLVASVGPLIPGALIALALIAYTGPLGFWYWFWTSPIVRVTSLTIGIGMCLWTAYVMFAVCIRGGWYGRVAGSLTTAGAGLIALTALLPDWPAALRLLDRPLNAAPATETMLFALQTYAAVHLDSAGLSYVGVLFLVGGYWTAMRARTGILFPGFPRLAVLGARRAPRRYWQPAKGEAPHASGYQGRALGWLRRRFRHLDEDPGGPGDQVEQEPIVEALLVQEVQVGARQGERDQRQAQNPAKQ
jgi:hypothetical protein